MFKKRRGEAMEQDEDGKYHKVSYKPIEAQKKREEEEAMPAHSMATHALLAQGEQQPTDHIVEVKQPKKDLYEMTTVPVKKDDDELGMPMSFRPISPSGGLSTGLE